MRLRLLLVAVLSLWGCNKAGEAPAAAPSAQSEDERRALALSEPKGDGASAKGVRAWQARAKAQPEKPELWLALAEAWINHARTDGDAGDYLSAEAAAALSAEYGGGAAAAGVQAMVLLNRHQFRATQALAKQTLAKNPDDLRTLAALADAQLELGELDAVAVTVQHMVDLKPSLPSYSRASYLRWLNGDAETAIKYVRLALDASRDPHQPEPRAWTLCQAAAYFWNQGDYEGALAGYRQALELLPSYPPALQGEGRALLALGRTSEAAASLKRSFELRPLVETGALWAEAGGEDAVRKTEEEGKRGDAYGLGLFWATRNEHTAEAVALLEKEKGDRPGVYVRDALAWAYYRAGRVADAERELPSVQATDARLWFHRGAILIAAGKADEGRALMKKALEKNPRWSVREAAEAKKLLGE
jgi:tetratricopeptide (TPR) repeat protein